MLKNKDNVDLKEADKMFEKLGYIQKEKGDNWVEYYNEEYESMIGFYDFTFYGKRVQSNCFEGITMEEITAINEKLKELGWIK